MQLKKAILASILCCCFAFRAHAATIYFEFSNVTGNVPGTVIGKILGLTDNATSAATDLLITYAPPTLAALLPSTPFSVFTYANSLGGLPVSTNTFTLAGGTVTAAAFQVGGGFFDLAVQNKYNQLVAPNYTTAVRNQSGFAAVTFSDTPLATTVPEPAGIALLSSGVLMLLAVRRRRRTQENRRCW